LTPRILLGGVLPHIAPELLPAARHKSQDKEKKKKQKKKQVEAESDDDEQQQAQNAGQSTEY